MLNSSIIACGDLKAPSLRELAPEGRLRELSEYLACARLLYSLIKLTGSSAVINFASREYAHAKYFDSV